MKNILIAYYSKTGNTEKIAKEIASLCNADSEVIQPSNRADQGLRFIKTLFHTGSQSVSEIQPSTKKPDGYDIIVIGTPVWMFKLSSFARAYLKRHAKDFKQVAFFCTEGGNGDKKVFEQMTKEVGKPAITTLVISEKELKEQNYQSKLTSFVDHLVAEKVAI